MAVKRKRKPPRQMMPRAIQASYYRAIKDALMPSWRRIVQALSTALKDDLGTRKDSPRADAAVPPHVRRMTARASERLMDSVRENRYRLENLAESHATQTLKFQRVQLGHQVKALAGIDLSVVDRAASALVPGFIEENTLLIRRMGEDLRSGVEREVERAFREGRRWEELQGALEERLGVSESRAALIARDQIGKLYSNVNETRQRSLGAKKYIWRTMNDERVRPEHEEREGETFSWDDPPDGGNPGEEVLCFPGNTQLTPSSRVRKLYRRWYRGNLTDIITVDGVSLCATPNHPILTDSGWKSAKSIKIGDYVVDVRFQRIDMPIENLQGADASFVQVFSAVQQAGLKGFRDSRLAWFHGDVSDEQVDIIDIDGGLRVEIPSELSQSACNDVLTFAYDSRSGLGNFALAFGRMLLSSYRCVRGASQLLARIGVEEGIAREHSLAAVTWLNAAADKLRTNGRSTDAEALRYLFYAAPLGIKDRDHIARVILGIVGRAVMTSTSGDAALAQFDTQNVSIDTQTSGSLSDGGSFGHHFRRVVEKRRCINTGCHVYNLQSDSGLYVAQNLVVHNCRCFAEPIFEETAAEEET